MSVNALYQAPDNGLLYWLDNGKGTKMWIYGVAEPPAPDPINPKSAAGMPEELAEILCFERGRC
mgnify:CR=1 FL=1